MIASVPLFAECSKAELRRIAGIADEIHQAVGSELITQGARGGEFCVLVDGTVDVHFNGKHLRTLSSGDFFGEIALILDVRRSATVTATSPVRLLVVDRASFGRLMRDVPTIQGKILQALAARLADESL
jgi:CRP-like cAMP-binding protein